MPEKIFEKDDYVYISGPITGRPELNKANFDNMATFLRQTYGCKVFNPAELPEGWSYETYMRVDLEEIVSRGVTCIVLLDGWEASKGCQVEYAVAAILGIRVVHEWQIRDSFRNNHLSGSDGEGLVKNGEDCGKLLAGA